MSRPSRNSMVVSPFGTMMAAAVGLAAGVAIALGPAGEWLKSHPNVAAHVWVLLVGANVAVWTLLVVPVVQRLRRVEQIARGSWAVTALTAASFGALFSVPLWPWSVKWLAGLEVEAGDILLPIVGGIVAAAATAGIWRVHVSAKTLYYEEGAEKATTPSGIIVYLELQDHLQAFLSIVGTIISLGTLTLGFAMKAMHVANEVTVVFGFYYAGLLALQYIPAQLLLSLIGRGIRDEVASAAPVGAAELERWLRHRRDLDGLLQLDRNPLANLRTSIFVLSPLLTSLVSTVFKSG